MATDPAPTDGDFVDWFERGNRNLLEDDCEAALAAFDRALALRPGELAAIGARATAFLGLDRFEDAIAAFSTLVENVPDFAAGYLGRAGAIAALRTARGPEALGAADVELVLADYGRALQLDDEIEGRALIHYLRGFFLNVLGEFSKAAEDFEAASKLDPSAAAYLVHLGDARFQAGDPDGGTAAIQRAVNLVQPPLKRGGRPTERRRAPRRSRPSRV